MTPQNNGEPRTRPQEAETGDLYVAAFRSLPLSMAVLDVDGTVVDVNGKWQGFAVTNGGPPDGYLGYNYLDVSSRGSDPYAKDANDLIRSILTGDRSSGEMEYPCHCPTRKRWFLMHAWRFQDKGQVRVAVMHFEITRRRLAEDALRERADRDPLTGLLNRNSFAERAEHALARVRRDGKPLSLMFVDLDRFKAVNDTHGHEMGDRVLQVIAERLTQSVRETDAPARIGGDEFAVLLEAADSETASFMAERIKAVTRKPLKVDDHTFDLGCSVGMATTLDGKTTIRRLLQDADDAMYAGKQVNDG